MKKETKGKNLEFSKGRYKVIMLIIVIGIVGLVALVLSEGPEPSQTITIGDFRCSGHNAKDKENCVELAQFKLISEILKDKNVSEILREIDRLS